MDCPPDLLPLCLFSVHGSVIDFCSLQAHCSLLLVLAVCTGRIFRFIICATDQVKKQHFSTCFSFFYLLAQHLVLPRSWGKDLNISPLCFMLTVDLLHVALTGVFSPQHICCSVLKRGHWVLSNVFSASNEMITQHLSSTVNVMHHIYWSVDADVFLHSRDKSHSITGNDPPNVLQNLIC